MEPVRYYLVSADHVHPDYRFDHYPVSAHRDSGGNWYARAPRLGCSKDYATPEAAVRSLLLGEACTNIRLVPREDR